MPAMLSSIGYYRPDPAQPTSKAALAWMSANHGFTMPHHGNADFVDSVLFSVLFSAASPNHACSTPGAHNMLPRAVAQCCGLQFDCSLRSTLGQGQESPDCHGQCLLRYIGRSAARLAFRLQGALDRLMAVASPCDHFTSRWARRRDIAFARSLVATWRNCPR